MILENLRDRRPYIFPQRGAKASTAEVAMSRRLDREAKRRLDVFKVRGTGKARIWAERLLAYKRGLAMLILRPRILAELAAYKDSQDQLAMTGGIESLK